MPIRYFCDSCRQLLSIGTRMAGRTVNCPRCGAPTTVPAADEPAVASPLPAVLSSPATPEEESGRPAADVVRAEDASDSDGFQLPHREIEIDEMDLTPMVDMTFLLLIFFMITASFSLQKSIEVPPPSPEQKGAVQTSFTLEQLEANAVIVRIDDRNGITVDDEPLTDPTKLAGVLRNAISTRRNELVLSADDAALHETVIAVIDAANDAGMQRIRMASRGME